MTDTVDYLGKDFLGQVNLRRKINFLIDAYKAKKFLDNWLFVAKRGDGKTKICRKIAKALGKKTIEINGASLQNVGEFVDAIVVPHIAGNQDVTLFIDEISAIHSKVVEWLLSVLQYDPETKSSAASYGGTTYDFNFNHLTVLTATTNPEALSEPFRSRFRRLEFSAYSEEELIAILRLYTAGVEYHGNVEKDIVEAGRNSPREIALRLAEDVKSYLAQKTSAKNQFTPDDWRQLCNTLSTSPYGLSPSEVKLLEILSEGPCSLTCLAGKFNLDTSTLKNDIELFPLANNLFIIDGKRQITSKGREVLKRIKEMAGTPTKELAQETDVIINAVL